MEISAGDLWKDFLDFGSYALTVNRICSLPPLFIRSRECMRTTGRMTMNSLTDVMLSGDYKIQNRINSCFSFRTTIFVIFEQNQTTYRGQWVKDFAQTGQTYSRVYSHGLRSTRIFLMSMFVRLGRNMH